MGYKLTKCYYVNIEFDTHEQLCSFLQWKLTEKIYSSVPGGMSGGIFYTGFYGGINTAKIRKYLEANEIKLAE